MKKLILLLVLMVVTIVANSQTVNLPGIKVGSSFAEWSTDYTLTNTTARTYVVRNAQNYPMTQDFRVDLDSLAGNHTNVAVALYGAKFSDTAYSQIGSTVNWKGTTADTTILISNATANRYRYYKWVITGTGTGTTTVSYQALKSYFE